MFFIFQLQKSNVEDEIHVIDLSSYKEFKAKKLKFKKQPTKQTNRKKNQKEIVKEKPEIKNQKEIVEKKQENVIQLKKMKTKS